MKYYVEQSLSNFSFWSGGKDRAELLTSEQLDEVEAVLEEIEPEEGWSDTAINDMFWFEFDTICDWLGYADEEHLEKDISKDFMQEVEEWGEDTSTDYNSMFAIAGLIIEEYETVDEDGEKDMDWDSATDDFNDWWDNLDDFEKVEVYNRYQ